MTPQGKLRETLGLIQHLVDESLKAIATLPEDDREKIGRDLSTASDSITGLQESNMVTCEGLEPLNKTETVVFDNLNNHLRLPPGDFEELTHKQKFSAARVIVHHGIGTIRHPVHSDEYLGISFGHKEMMGATRIFIGIEKDGYAHS